MLAIAVMLAEGAVAIFMVLVLENGGGFPFVSGLSGLLIARVNGPRRG